MALRQVAAELTEYARILETTANILLQRNMQRYPIVDGNCALRVWRLLDGNCLDPQTRINGSSYRYWDDTDWWWGSRRYNVTTPGYIDISPSTCRDDEVIWLRMWMATSHDAAVLPKILWDEHRMAMMDGFKWAMMDMVGAEWSDPQGAKSRRKNFELRMSQARTGAEKRYTTAFGRIAPPRVL